jgi:hypothetical protein
MGAVLEEFDRKWEKGYPIFCKFFELPSKELIEKVSQLVGEKFEQEVGSDCCDVIKTTKNDKPYLIEINNMNAYTINGLGISRELYGEFGDLIIPFDHDFIF